MKDSKRDGYGVYEHSDGSLYKGFWKNDKFVSSSKSFQNSKINISVNLTRLTNSVMNGWRADYKNEMSSLISCASN